MLKDLLPIIFIIPLFILMIVYGRMYNKYRDLYQEKMKPKYPVSGKAVTEDFLKDPLNFIKKAPMLSLIGWELEFGRIDDPELKRLQWKVRKYSIVIISYAFIGFVIIFVVNTYFLNQ